MSKVGNSVTFIGRFTRDPELKTAGETSVCNFCLARQRDGVRPKDGQTPPSEFVDFAAWGKTAETISKYFHKGDRIAVIGSLQTRTYENNTGVKVKVTEVHVDEFEWVDTKSKGGSDAAQTSAPAPSKAPAKEVTPDPADDDEGLPF